MYSTPDLTTRARIRNAALTRFAAEGAGRVSVRDISAEAGVSPALVIHHFGSKAQLRQACDAYVVSLLQVGDPAAGTPPGLAAMLDAPPAARRYLARAFLDDSPEAAALFDQIVSLVDAWLAEGEREGWAQPATDPRARAAIYVTWLFAPFIFESHLSRVLGIVDLSDRATLLRHSRVALQMLRDGLFTDDRGIAMLDALQQRRQFPR